MVINKHDLFESTKALWPDTVDLTLIDAANKIYQTNEEAFSVNDHWRQFALWSFHQRIAKLENRAIANGATTFRPEDLEFSTFDRWMRVNLSDDDWVAERNEWECTS